MKEMIKKLDGGKYGTNMVGTVLKKTLTPDYIYYLKKGGNIIPNLPIKTKIMSVKPLNCNQLELTWEEANDTRISGQDMVTGYRIYYAIGETAAATIINIDNQKTTQYTVKKLKSGQKYVFKVQTVFKKYGYEADGDISRVFSKSTEKCKVTLNRKNAEIDMEKSKKLYYEFLKKGRERFYI